MIKLRKAGNVMKVLGLALATAAAGCATAGDSSDGLEARAAKTGDGRYIVKFREGKKEHGKKALQDSGATIDLELGPQEAVAAKIPAHAMGGLQNHADIEYIEEDSLREPMALWNEKNPSGGEIVPYGVQMVQADRITSPNIRNRKVCIIDSGYSPAHGDLRDQGDGVTFTNLAGSGSWDKDSCGHGSHVAGTIAAVTGNGTGVASVAPGVSLHIEKVFGDDNLPGGSCRWTYTSELIGAVNDCVANGANVISMSLGGADRSRLEDAALKSAYSKGVLLIAAAGNAGTRNTSYPAGYDVVMSVAAIDANEVKAAFSQFNRDVEIAAPGVAVLSTVPWLESNSLTVSLPNGQSAKLDGHHVEGAPRTNGLSGNLVDGGQCTASNSAWAGKVVLCQRGTISFAEKVNFVSGSGGVAAVIYNNASSDATCGGFSGTMGEGVTASIPAITLSCADGATALGGSSGTVVSSVTYSASGYEAWDGTSMATPHVSAVAALIWSCNPGKTNAQIRAAMNGTARDLGSRGRDNSYGYGVVQAVSALQSLGLGTCTVN